MIRNAKDELSSGQTIEADVCIVGSGAAGITLARELIGTGMRVVVLEGGGEEDLAPIRDLYRGRESGANTWTIDRWRRRQLGGSTNDWAGWCIPFERSDFEARSWIDDAAWPIGIEDLQAHYVRAAGVVELGDFNYDVEDAVRRSGYPLWHHDVDAPGFETRVFRYSPPTRFGTRYRPELQDASNVDVWLFAHLRGIVLNAAENAISHLDVQAWDGDGAPVPFVVEAPRVVLAAGGIENARLLLASQTRSAEGVGNGHDLVGRYFMEHPHYYSSAGMVLGENPDLRLYGRRRITVPDDGGEREVDILAVLAPNEALREEEQLLDFGIELLPGRQIEDRRVATEHVPPLLGTDASVTFKFNMRTEQVPHRDNRIELSDEVDALGLPRCHMTWDTKEQDRRSMTRSVRAMSRVLNRGTKARLWTPLEGDEFHWGAAPGGHHMGTTRMGASAETGVVDANCECFGVSGLFVAGSSVFRTGASANPTLTIVALALRLAEHLKGLS